MRYLLDTNILSALLRDPRGVISERIRAVGETNVCTSIIVAAELRSGVQKRGSAGLLAQLEQILGVLDVVAFESPGDVLYGEIRSALERAGSPIGANDLLLAAHAMALECTLVTDNCREFERVEGLLVENWLRP